MKLSKRSLLMRSAYILAASSAVCSAANATDYNYAEALQKSIYFYEAQQSGPIPAWNRTEWRGDSGLTDGSDNGVDLTGGWYDAGDHVKFGFPMASSATMLAWGAVDYPEAYANSGQLEHMQNNLRFVADYFIKAHTAEKELYGQVGGGSADHAWWGPAEVMQMERPSYKITESCPGTDLAGETAAAMAAISMVFKDTDPTYSATLLAHAKELYAFAFADGDESKRGIYSDCITDAATFYKSWSGYKDELVWSALWLYRATGDSAYLDQAKLDYANLSTEGQSGTIKSYKWTQAWDDKSYGNYVLMASLAGGDEYEADAERWLDYWSDGYNGEQITYTPGGLAYLDTWGANRYAANTSFLALVYSDFLKTKDSSSTKASSYYDFALSQINYILGDNPKDMSYLIGFGDSYTKNPHHRTMHGSWSDSQSVPEESRHILVGALVGGPNKDDSYEDDRSNYTNNEVATDYNSGFTGAVARLSMDFAGSTLTNFPVAETRDTEFRVQAKLNSSGSNYAEISMHVQNMSAWPARSADNLRARYYVDISEALDAGYSLSDLTVTTAYNQGKSVSDLTLYSGTVYYVEVSFEGIDIYPGGQSAFYKEVQLRIAGPTGTNFWDNSNDPSWSNFTGSSHIDADGIVLIDADDNSILWGDGFTVEDPCEENCAPTADNATVTSVSGEAVNITLSADDQNGTVASYNIVTEPTNGTLTGTGSALVYTSTTDYVGSDSFTYNVTDDEGAVSNTATVSISVKAEAVEVDPGEEETTPGEEEETTPTTPTSGLTCSIGSIDQWSNGFVLNNIKVTNATGEAVTSWEVQIQLDASGIKLGNNWNSSVSLDSDNILTAKNVGYNGSLANGASTTFGLQGSFSGDWVTPYCIVEESETPVTEPVEEEETPVTEPVEEEETPVTDPTEEEETPVTDPTEEEETPVTDPTEEEETPVTDPTEGEVTPIPDDETNGLFRIDDSGNVTKGGEILPMNCVSWFGLEGQFEPKDAANNAGGAPMELYMGNMWWANSSEGTGRTIEQTMQEIVATGVTVIRMPIAPQTLDATNEQGIGDIQSGGVLKNHKSVRQDNARQALTDFIIAADKYDLNVIIDIHSCSNYLGWRAGDLEASPPYTDADREDYDYTREDYSCSFEGVGDGVTVQEYNETLWKQNLAEIAGLPAELGVNNIVGIDIFNEPWNYTWTEWKALAESAYATISAVNDDMLIVVEGIGSSLKEGTEVEHGSLDYTPNWGENLYSFQNAPLNIPKNRLILSPHTYGPSVFVQNHFLDESQEQCADLDGDAAGEAKCDIVIDPTRLAAGWDEHFGYLREQGYAVLIGEFGGMMDWPSTADTYYKNLWSHASNTVDKEWQTALVDYMVEKEIEGCYWSLNPESADTGGIFEHAYSDSNAAGWGEWLEMDTDKVSLLEYLWKGVAIPGDGDTTEPGETDPSDGDTTEPGETDPSDGDTTEPGETDPSDGDTTEPTTGLTCTDGRADIWSGGVVLNNYNVTNNGSETLSSWEIELDFGNTVNVTNIWNASAKTSGDIVTVYGSNLQAGQSVNFGFQGAYSGSIVTPSCESTATDPGETDPGETDPGETDPGETDPGETTPVAGSQFRIDDTGNVTKAGEILPMNCVSWFGLEGQFEPKDAENNPGGAPMELYMGNMWWANSSAGTGRTIEQTMEEIVAKGVTVIRMPIAPQTLDATNEQGTGDIQNGGVLKNHESVRQTNSRQALTDFIIAADKYDLNVIIDIHSCSNYLGWRAGDLEATPPYTDANREDYDFTREEYSCGTDVGSGVIVQEYNETIWKQNLAEIAGLSAELGVDNIVGIDIFNEPWNYTWAEWKALAESAYETISANNDDMLIIVEGIGSSLKDDTKVEHGSLDYTPNWGENLYSFQNDPLDIPKDRLILSPHTYGPSVFVQNHFLDLSKEECIGLDGDAAGEAECDIVINPATLAKGWDEHFGYLREQGYAVLIGEFGGKMDWPLSADQYYQDLWSHASSSVDKEWQTALVDYMDENNIEGCYWSLNPESADTGGIYGHLADTDDAGWGTWLEMDQDKISLLNKLWK